MAKEKCGEVSNNQETEKKEQKFYQKYAGEIGLGVLILYVILLGLGTVGEVFEIDWILNLWIFK